MPGVLENHTSGHLARMGLTMGKLWSADVWRAASLTSAASGSIERWHAAMAASSFIACTAGTARDAGGAPSSGLAGSRA